MIPIMTNGVSVIVNPDYGKDLGSRLEKYRGHTAVVISDRGIESSASVKRTGQPDEDWIVDIQFPNGVVLACYIRKLIIADVEGKTRFHVQYVSSSFSHNKTQIMYAESEKEAFNNAEARLINEEMSNIKEIIVKKEGE